MSTLVNSGMTSVVKLTAMGDTSSTCSATPPAQYLVKTAAFHAKQDCCFSSKATPAPLQ
jgi:hypothetical protein